jgi:hypothetical protein
VNYDDKIIIRMKFICVKNKSYVMRTFLLSILYYPTSFICKLGVNKKLKNCLIWKNQKKINEKIELWKKKPTKKIESNQFEQVFIFKNLNLNQSILIFFKISNLIIFFIKTNRIKRGSIPGSLPELKWRLILQSMLLIDYSLGILYPFSFIPFQLWPLFILQKVISF